MAQGPRGGREVSMSPFIPSAAAEVVPDVVARLRSLADELTASSTVTLTGAEVWQVLGVLEEAEEARACRERTN
jgi:hypothetical protein